MRKGWVTVETFIAVIGILLVLGLSLALVTWALRQIYKMMKSK
jgi:uncharacterized membrane protein